MAKVINVGVRPEHIQRRARILEDAGHEIRNAYSISELQPLLHEGGEVLVIGHNLDDSEKRRILHCMEESGNHLAVVEMYMYVPELMTANEHVHWESGSEALVAAVDRACRAAEGQQPVHRRPATLDPA